MNIYIQCALIAVLGGGLKIWQKFIGQRSKAKDSNVKFNSKEWARMDWPTWIETLIAIGICMLLIDILLQWKPWMMLAIKPIFATVGWVGADLVVTGLGASNKWINAMINIKTTIADKVTGQIHIPTELPKTAEDKQKVIATIAANDEELY